jgi:hypothetical protein
VLKEEPGSKAAYLDKPILISKSCKEEPKSKAVYLDKPKLISKRLAKIESKVVQKVKSLKVSLDLKVEEVAPQAAAEPFTRCPENIVDSIIDIDKFLLYSHQEPYSIQLRHDSLSMLSEV